MRGWVRCEVKILRENGSQDVDVCLKGEVVADSNLDTSKLEMGKK